MNINERVRDFFKENLLAFDDDLTIENDDNIDTALNWSDMALYKAKNSGRNQVIIHSVS